MVCGPCFSSFVLISCEYRFVFCMLMINITVFPVLSQCDHCLLNLANSSYRKTHAREWHLKINYISALTFLLGPVGFGRPATLFPSAVYLRTVSKVSNAFVCLTPKQFCFTSSSANRSTLHCSDIIFIFMKIPSKEI